MAILTSIGWKMQPLLLSSDRKSRICHRIVPLRLLYIMILTYIFKVMNLYLETARASEKCSLMTFIEVDICHRMGALRMVYSVTLAFICYKKLRRQRMFQADLPRLARPPPTVATVNRMSINVYKKICHCYCLSSQRSFLVVNSVEG